MPFGSCLTPRQPSIGIGVDQLLALSELIACHSCRDGSDKQAQPHFRSKQHVVGDRAITNFTIQYAAIKIRSKEWARTFMGPRCLPGRKDQSCSHWRTHQDSQR
jgi:hypothetical protein